MRVLPPHCADNSPSLVITLDTVLSWWIYAARQDSDRACGSRQCSGKDRRISSRLPAHRRFAAAFFLFATVSWTASILIQHRFRISSGLPTSSVTQEFGNLVYTLVFAAFAAFAIFFRERAVS